MHPRIYSRLLTRQWQALKLLPQPISRAFHATAQLHVVKPFLLADIGEGIRECEIIQWFVEPEAKVEEWDKLCEVQSDKASVEITSQFAGVIKKLHHEPGEMAKVGKPLVDIDIVGEFGKDSRVLTEGEESALQAEVEAKGEGVEGTSTLPVAEKEQSWEQEKHAALATPAVRHLIKELDINIEDIRGTGKAGRILKEDVNQLLKQREAGSLSTSQPAVSQTWNPPPSTGPQQETVVPLTNTQAQMFKTMTKSLSIPHFMYADEIDFTSLCRLRAPLNQSLSQHPMGDITKLSFLPFIIKAVSLALNQYPILNARVDIDSTTSKPTLVHRTHHNIGIAIDTPSGLLVPVLKNVTTHSIFSIASQLARLQALATEGKLTPDDLSGGTITISNIGVIGGTYVSPVIVEKEVAILGIGKIRSVPAFGEDGGVERKEVCNFSWCADHRVVEGAVMARAGEVVRRLVERPEEMILHLR